MTAVKGLDFISTYNNSTIEQVNETPVRIIHLQNLLEAKKAAGRNFSLNSTSLSDIYHSGLILFNFFTKISPCLNLLSHQIPLV